MNQSNRKKILSKPCSWYLKTSLKRKIAVCTSETNPELSLPSRIALKDWMGRGEKEMPLYCDAVLTLRCRYAIGSIYLHI